MNYLLFISKALATGLGSGLSPKAPGTTGSIAAFLISTFLLQFAGDPLINLFHLVLVIITFFVGVWATRQVSKEWGHDPGKIVIDEWCGLWLTYVFCPPTLTYFIIGLLLFRIFDISKILGIKRLDDIKGPYGVMLDDILAGLYSGVCCLLIYWSGVIEI